MRRNRSSRMRRWKKKRAKRVFGHTAVCSLKLGHMRALVIGGILHSVAVAAFAALAFAGTGIPLFALVMAGDNFGISFAGVALIAYMSSLTNLGYTATQYALLS